MAKLRFDRRPQVIEGPQDGGPWGSRGRTEGHKSLEVPRMEVRWGWGLKRSNRRSQVTGAPWDEAVLVVDTRQALIGQVGKYL
jgi:hypothetical protein